jgi:poly(3-hydroxyalkanoate) depolymerase
MNSDAARNADHLTTDHVGADLNIRMIDVHGQRFRVAVKPGARDRPPLLLFNGIGANLELAEPFLRALPQLEAAIFDVPGIGGSPLPSRPYRPSTLARWAAEIVAQLGYGKVDVAGVSWGGGAAQQFAHQYPDICRKLVLAATSPGAIMVPGRLSALLKLASPRRYTDRSYMMRIAAEIYGGALRENPGLIAMHAANMRGASNLGYLYQLLALTGWTSLPWLRSLTQPTLVLMGRDDPLVPVINGHILARLIPRARLQIIDDGHLFFLTQPQHTAAIVERFLASD